VLFDATRCIGCRRCEAGCNQVNGLPAPAKPFDDLSVLDRRRRTDAKTYTIVNRYDHLPGATGPVFRKFQCNHCLEPACASACFVKAFRKDPTGAVVYDPSLCVGCRYCMVACPYDARRFNWGERQDVNEFVPTWGIAEVERRPRGVVEKCTFCVHRIDAGLANGLVPGVDPEATPACVNICPVDARVFGDLMDPESRVAKLIENSATFRLREELGTRPSVYYIPPKEGV
jgi:Fe-S-cluster-containing dehydrogenase component